MAHVGTITGSMTLDPSAYIAGLNQAAQQTMRFQQSVASSGAGMASMGAGAGRAATQLGGLNRSIYASMTAFYMLSTRISAALGVYEEYSNVLSRIGATADMSTSSILGLSEALRGLNRDMGGSRTDMMKGMYRAVQSGFTTPDQFMPIAESAMKLRTASGREINTVKSADAISVIRNSLGIKGGKESMITDMLLKGRDVGRFELNEMTSALGIPLTIYGNQFSSKIGSQETLRQVITLLATSTQAGLSPNRAATGVRRMVEKTLMLGNKPGGIGKNLHAGFAGLGYANPIDALNEGPMKYLENLLKLTGGGSSEGLTKMGFGAREFMVLASTLRGNMGSAREIHEKLSAGNISGTTDKYADKQKEEWWYTRDRIRSAYEDSQINFVEAILPTMKGFAASIEVVNDLFQALSPAVKNIIALMTIGAGFNLMKNFFVRPGQGGGAGGGAGADHFALQSMRGLMPVVPQHLRYSPSTVSPNASSISSPSRISNLPYGIAGTLSGPFSMPGGFKGVPEGYRGEFDKDGLKIRNAKGQYGDNRGVSYYAGNNPRYPSIYGGTVGYNGPKIANDPVGRPYPTASTPFANLRTGPAKTKPGFPTSGPQYSKFGTLAGRGLIGGANAAQFAFGGADYRNEYIKSSYDTKMVGAHNKYHVGADRAMSNVRDMYAQSKFDGTAFNQGSAEKSLGTALKGLQQEFDKTAKGATKSAMGMSKLSGVLGTIGSIANMAAIGGIFALLAKFMEGYGNKGEAKSDAFGVTDFSKAGRDSEDVLGLWDHAGTGMSMMGSFANPYVPKNRSDFGMLVNPLNLLSGGAYYMGKKYLQNEENDKNWQAGEYAHKQQKALYRKYGMVWDGDKNKYVRSTQKDAWTMAVEENFTDEEKLALGKAGYARYTDKLQAEKDKWLASPAGGKRIGLDTDASLNRIIDGKGTLNSGIEANVDFLKATMTRLGKVVEKTTEAFVDLSNYVKLSNTEEFSKRVGKNAYAGQSFWNEAKRKKVSLDEQTWNDAIRKSIARDMILPDSFHQGELGGLKVGDKELISNSLARKYAGQDYKYTFRKDMLPEQASNPLYNQKNQLNLAGDYNKVGGTPDGFDRTVTGARMLEMLRTKDTDSDENIRSLMKDIFGPDKTNLFMNQAVANWRNMDVGEFVGLEKGSERFSTPVQKYSEALAYGSKEGYNATLPYWAETGDQKLEAVFKSWPLLLEYLRKTAASTDISAQGAQKQSTDGGGDVGPDFDYGNT